VPITIPPFDARRYQDLRDEALDRIPQHNPEWTNFNESDPGVTLVELFAFLTESLLYRAALIPERNRAKFLQLLGVPLQPGASARGLVNFTDDRGPLRTLTLNAGVEVASGPVPFRTERGLDVLPVEAQVWFKQRVQSPRPELRAYYEQLYASYKGTPPAAQLDLYQAVPFLPRTDALDLGADTVDGSLWIALLVRSIDKPYDAQLDRAREALAGKTLSLGVVPALADPTARLAPGAPSDPAASAQLEVFLPKLPPDGLLPDEPSLRVPDYQALHVNALADVLAEPGVLEVTLPSKDQLGLWQNLGPIEAGAGAFPPALDDGDQGPRLITWLRLRSASRAPVRLLWVGVNAVMAAQRTHVAGEVLPDGTGQPDQEVTLSRPPVLAGSVRLTVVADGRPAVWTPIDDLSAAGPEVPRPDPRLPPGAAPPPAGPSTVYALDAEAGKIRFGDGAHGARPPLRALLRADYDSTAGRDGNLGVDAITQCAALPTGWKVTNPVPTWGGADAEGVRDGERQVSRWLQHRDRLVTAADFEALVRRTPGVDVARVDVLPTFHPDLSPSLPGDAPGVVTLMVVPRHDAARLDAPMPDRVLLNQIACWLEPRRVVTSEVLLRGPTYRDVSVSIGLEVVAGYSPATVREAVRAAIGQALSPLPDPAAEALDDDQALLQTPAASQARRGWPLGKAVAALELLAVASRVEGVQLVRQVLLLDDAGAVVEDAIPMTGLELPRVGAVRVGVGDPPPFVDEGQPPSSAVAVVPVPVVPEECR
jgi:hypothetical protein